MYILEILFIELIHMVREERMIETSMRSDQAITTLLDKQDLYFSVYAYHKMARLQKALESVQCNHAVFLSRKVLNYSSSL